VPDEDDDEDFEWPPYIEGEISLEDLLTRGVAFSATHNPEGGYDSRLTLSLRRPPQLTINDRGVPPTRRHALSRYSRRTTELDWCYERNTSGRSDPVDPLPTTGESADLHVNVGSLSYNAEMTEKCLRTFFSLANVLPTSFSFMLATVTSMPSGLHSRPSEQPNSLPYIASQQNLSLTIVRWFR